MAETGPSGPDTEIHFDCGPEWGEEGGPATGLGRRYVELWNLVFMQNFLHPDGSLTDLPRKNVDTGAGFERWLTLLEDVPTIFDTSALRPMVTATERVTARAYGDDASVDYYLKSIADHARCVTFLVNDGVVPSNEGRGYVCRSVIRRAVRRGYQLGVERPFLPELVDAAVDLMADAYPELVKNRTSLVDVIGMEEERFRQTLRAGTALLDTEMATGRVRGAVAFKLHDTFGFPIEVTAEVAEERGVPLDREGFDTAMAEQRRRGNDARKAGAITEVGSHAYAGILEEHGPTEFTGYQEVESKATVLAVLDAGEGRIEVFLDRTPFYAEGGGQVGDTGTLTAVDGTATVRVLDTTYALAGLTRHVVEMDRGRLEVGMEVVASIDTERRAAIRRNHTGTHLLHWALREVLGPQVRQQSSYVGPDRLRFDINHHAPLTAAQLRTVEDMVNDRVLDNEPVRAYETSMDHAKELGAIMFFGDKYGDRVRVVEAGERSMELCGGTHVHALGTIGPLKIVSEGSIGSNLRRIEAVTGTGTIAKVRETDALLASVAELLRTTPDEVAPTLERVLAQQRAMSDELKLLRNQLARGEASELARAAVEGLVVLRRDDLTSDQLRDLAVAIRDEHDIRGAFLVGSPDGERVAVAGAVTKDSGLVAGEFVVEAAKITGGGGNAKAAEVAVAGGRDPARIDEAVAAIRARAGLPAA